MNVLEKTLLVLPDLDEVLAISVELAELLRVDLKYHHHIVIGAIQAILAPLILRWHSDSISTLFVVKHLYNLQ